MRQYLDLLTAIQTNGTAKPAARSNMPGTTSLFGYQLRHNLADGFPLLTTKRVFWKGVVIELLWFLRGDANIKFLVDNGVNIWNEDAYQYYKQLCNANGILYCTFDDFVSYIKTGEDRYVNNFNKPPAYEYGDCGWQYGKLWRGWEKFGYEGGMSQVISINHNNIDVQYIDQIADIIKGLRSSPDSRRHMLTALNPPHYNDLALFPCHCLAQFNCRPLTFQQRLNLYIRPKAQSSAMDFAAVAEGMDEDHIPKYYLDCQSYQRSADTVLGVPFNIASYALLTHILAKICNMVPGEVVFSYGDVHIYDNHKEAVAEQLQRTPTTLPTLELSDDVDWLDVLTPSFNYNYLMEALSGYNPQTAIKAELSTGLIK